MTVTSHIAELERRHSALEKQIEASRQGPATDPLTIAEMKRRKLKLRDEIEKLRVNGGRATVH